MINNDLTFQVYRTGTTPIYDAGGELLRGSGLWFANGYPTGPLAGGILIPRQPTRWWEVDGLLRVAIRHGQKLVYEGWIPSLEHRFSPTAYGNQINFTGAFGTFLLNRAMRKRWADNRVDDRIWEWVEADDATLAAAAADKCLIDRDRRLRFMPKSEVWAANDYAAVRFTMPPGETIKRITFDYEIVSAGATWSLIVYDIDHSSAEATYTQTGAGTTSGSCDIDSTSDFTAAQVFELQYKNTSGSTPTSDGSTYCNITNLVVYSENEGATGINLNSVGADIIAAHTDIFNSDTQYLLASSNVRSVEPFVTNGHLELADILSQIAEFGDSNDNRWAVGCKFSEDAATPNGLPVLFAEAWPTTTDYEYFLPRERAESLNIVKDFESIANYIIVGYQDERGYTQWVTPDNDASLTDSTSVSDYGTRQAVLRLGNATEANAINYGARYLAEKKDPQWIVPQEISVTGYIEGKYGQPVPACRITPGERIEIDGYDTFVLSMSNYDHEARAAGITIGKPSALVFNESIFAATWNDPVPTAGGASSGGSTGSGVSTDDRLGLHWLKKQNPKLYKRIKNAAIAYRKEHGDTLKNAVRRLGYGHLMRWGD